MATFKVEMYIQGNSASEVQTAVENAFDPVNVISVTEVQDDEGIFPPGTPFDDKKEDDN